MTNVITLSCTNKKITLKLQHAVNIRHLSNEIIMEKWSNTC